MDQVKPFYDLNERWSEACARVRRETRRWLLCGVLADSAVVSEHTPSRSAVCIFKELFF